MNRDIFLRSFLELLDKAEIELKENDLSGLETTFEVAEKILARQTRGKIGESNRRRLWERIFLLSQKIGMKEKSLKRQLKGLQSSHLDMDRIVFTFDVS